MAVSSADIDSNDTGARQSRTYRAAVGHDLPSSKIEEALELALIAKPPTIYDAYSDVPLPWKHITTPRWNEKVLELVNSWADHESNIRRAETCVGRPALKRGRDLVRKFGLFILGERLDSAAWHPVPGGLGEKLRSPQTVVFIALTDLRPENGFFMDLKRGEDVVVDSNADIKFPAPGGGLGVCFNMDL